jgi:hypothetical protein
VSDGPDGTARAEFERQRRLVDQMTSMHSMLRDRYRQQATTATVVVLVLSVVALAFAFAPGDETVSLFGVEAQRSTWLGWFAVAVFSLTLIELVLDRRGAAGWHDDAVRQLATLKSAYRTPPKPGDERATVDAVSGTYQAVMTALPAIPERLFNRLKARHLSKVAVSRYVSDHPGCPAFVARWRVALEASK